MYFVQIIDMRSKHYFEPKDCLLHTSWGVLKPCAIVLVFARPYEIVFVLARLHQNSD